MGSLGSHEFASVKRADLLSPELVAAIQQHALEEYPKECAGVILTDGSYLRMQNFADDPHHHVRFDREALGTLMIEGRLAAIVHSHPNGPNFPSQTDMDFQQETDVPWIIVSTNGESCFPPFAFGDQVERHPLMERGFHHGVTDCYGLIRDYYWLEKGIVLPEFSRSWEWWNNHQQLYLAGFEKAGFVPVAIENLQVGDGILFSVRSNTPNHAAIYYGNDLILHHAAGRDGWDMSRLPKIEPLGRWLPYATHFLTYQG